MSLLFLDFGQENTSKIISFTQFSESEGLPFPLHLHLVWKTLFVLSLLFILVEGLKLTKVIVDFVISPESKLGPINYVILVDQINSLFLGISIIFQISVNICPIPLSILLGNEFCNFVRFIVAIYIGGSCIWGCFIALFRVLFIKAQNWLTNSVGVQRLLVIMLTFGALEIFLFAGVNFQIDGESPTKKLCYHLSFYDMAVIQDYQVRYCPILNFKNSQ
jgi:hypothetical protein